MASFSNINSEIILFSVVVLAVVIFVLRKDLALLNVITLGKDQAVNLGVDYDRTIRRLLLGVTLCIAVATAMVGPISFLGLIICKSVPAAFENLPSRSADPWICAVWNDRAGGRSADCGAGFYIRDSGQRVYYGGRRDLFPLSPADKSEGLNHADKKSYKKI